MATKQKTTPVEVKAIGDTILGVYWQDEYYPVTVKQARLTKDCSARIYTVKSDEQLINLRRDEHTGAWSVVTAV